MAEGRYIKIESGIYSTKISAANIITLRREYTGKNQSTDTDDDRVANERIIFCSFPKYFERKAKKKQKNNRRVISIIAIFGDYLLLVFVPTRSRLCQTLFGIIFY